MSVIDYQSARRDDSDENPSPERLRIRREIQAGFAHIGESASARAFRGRTEAAKRNGTEAKERRDAEQERWNRLFDARFDQNFDQRVWPEIGQEISDRIEERSGHALAYARQFAREHVAKAIEELRAEMESKLVAMVERLAATTGEFAQVRNWKLETVFYRGQLVANEGALYQARKDPARTPSFLGLDPCRARWPRRQRCRDGSSLNPRGAFDAKDSYAARDIVTHAGASYLALHDNPGLPGHDDGWMALSTRGEKGERGERGLRGSRGEKGLGATIESWAVDRERYRCWPRMSDGSLGPILELRPLFELYQQQPSE